MFIINPHVLTEVHDIVLISKNNMTSDSNDGYIVSASTSWNSTYAPYKACDSINATHWGVAAGYTTGWFKHKLPTAKVLKEYKILSRATSPDNAPHSWVLYGSNDDTNWTALDTISSQPYWDSSVLRSFSITNTNSYLYYKIDITSTGGSAVLSMAEFDLYGY